ncbi:class II fructose-bisphosphate aldolase [Mycetocola lacteus]|uniref:Class II fructose-bisphosphate aldolase n=1 Tax=Mycetocola lacteus TaxID=76637 RepID=A0A3L7ATC9_9MICO|nr:class II fructose-bisphosphate aldolase [Mycetocola lacteus]RLP83779.1 class II fructose-bisphosphate aldolase [Mycetocola lacteus]
MIAPSTLHGLPGLLAEARAQHTGVGAFNVVLLEHAEAIVAGAEEAGSPVILQISENCVRYHGSLTPILRGSLGIAAAARVPVLVHLDHIEDPELIMQGLRLGVDSVMYDGSGLDYAANVDATARIAARCHAAGVGIEAELGRVGGKDGVHAPGVRTDPGEAAAFVAATGVDALAVAVGSSHAMQQRTAEVDRDLIARLATAVPVPLVLHGSSGLSDDQLRGAIAAGMTKINISTHLNGLFTRAIRAELEQSPTTTDPRRYIARGKSAIQTETARLLRLITTQSPRITQ